MSQRRVCDLDQTVIDPEVDEFYTVTSGRSGITRDICYQCARSQDTVPAWSASTVYAVGARVKAATPPPYVYDAVFDVVVAGTAGAAQPTWSTIPGTLIVSGTVTFKVSVPPHQRTAMFPVKPGLTTFYSLYGWMSGTGEMEFA